MLELMFEVGIKEFAELGEPLFLYLDNYFESPKCIKFFRYKGVGVVGTASAKRNWPPEELKVRSLAGATSPYWMGLGRQG